MAPAPATQAWLFGGLPLPAALPAGCDPRGQATLPPFEHDVGVGASIARTLNSYGTGAVRPRYLRFGSATADPQDSADHLVGSNLAVAVATGGQGTLSTMMAILPFAICL